MNLLKRYKVEYEISCDEDADGEYCLNEDVKELERQNKIMKEALKAIVKPPTSPNYDEVYLLQENVKIAESVLKEVGE